MWRWDAPVTLRTRLFDLGVVGSEAATVRQQW